MSRKTVISFITLAILAGAAYGGYYYYSNLSKQNESTDLVLYGNVDIREVDLGFRVSGKVEKVYFDEGDHVDQGTLLASLEKTPFEEEVWRSKSQLQGAEVALSNAQKQYERRSKAISTSAISEEDYVNSQAKQEELQSAVEAGKAMLAQSLTRLNDTLLIAPTSGVILTRIREPGSVLSFGEPVFTLSLDTPIWIRAYVAEPDLGKIYPDMAAEVYTDTKTNRVYKGHIGFISPVAEFTPKNVETTELRTDLVYRLRIIVDDADSGLRQGMPVTVILKNASVKKS